MAQVAAVAWVQSLALELLHVLGKVKKKKKKAEQGVIFDSRWFGVSL